MVLTAPSNCAIIVNLITSFPLLLNQYSILVNFWENVPRLPPPEGLGLWAHCGAPNVDAELLLHCIILKVADQVYVAQLKTLKTANSLQGPVRVCIAHTIQLAQLSRISSASSLKSY